LPDDLGFPISFFFNDPDAMSFTLGIQLFAQSNPDISLVTAAGNDRQDYYQAVYAPSTGTSPIGLTPTGYTPETGGTTGRTYQSIMDIGGDPYEIVHVRASFSLAQPTYFLLTWNDPLKGPYDDLDLYLVDQTTGKILDASTYDQASDVNYAPSSASWNPPEEFVQYSGGPQALELVVMCYQCNQTQNLLVKLTGTLDGAGNFVHKADGGVYGQAAMAEEISVAAAHVTSGTNAAMENFSQTGPYIGGDWLNGTVSVPKPDITGIDGVTVSGAGGFGSPFYGTSAASPNVASVLALLRSAFPSSSYTAVQWKQLIESNANIASLSPAPTSSEAGAGLIDAHAGVASLDGGPITAKIIAPGSSSLNVVAPASVQFGASCAYGGSEQLHYSWNFGDSSIPASNQLQPAAVTYSKAGTYNVTFICSDQVQSASGQVQITVKPAPSSGGGGAFGLGGLAGLLAVAGLLALRRRR
jgi:PKD repeat protein